MEFLSTQLVLKSLQPFKPFNPITLDVSYLQFLQQTIKATTLQCQAAPLKSTAGQPFSRPQPLQAIHQLHDLQHLPPAWPGHFRQTTPCKLQCLKQNSSNLQCLKQHSSNLHSFKHVPPTTCVKSTLSPTNPLKPTAL